MPPGSGTGGSSTGCCESGRSATEPSPLTKEEMTRLLAIPAEKIHVIPAPPTRPCDGSRMKNWRLSGERYGLPERYLLFVGNFNPRKNLTRLMEAFDLLKSRPAGAGWKLVIAGEQGWKFDRRRPFAAIRCREDVLSPAMWRGRIWGPIPWQGRFIPPAFMRGRHSGHRSPAVRRPGDLPRRLRPAPGGGRRPYVDPMDPEDIRHQIHRLLTDPALGNQLGRRGMKTRPVFLGKISESLGGAFEQLL